MNKLIIPLIIAIVVLFVVVGLIGGGVYVIDETQQVVKTRFGKPVGKPIADSGLHFKVPFIDVARYFEKRILRWDGSPDQMPTKDKRYIYIDTTARWRVSDPLKFLQSVRNEVGAHRILDNIVDGAARDVVGSHVLVEAVRDSNRVLEQIKTETSGQAGFVSAEAGESIVIGREGLTQIILETAKNKVTQYGIELIDVRIKRITYVDDVMQKVYERMIAERKRAAEQYRSEGQGEMAKIEGRMEKELNLITSQAYKTVQEIKGDADAKAIKIYADAYGKDPAFYEFLKTMETYQNTIGEDSTIILTTDSDYYRYLKRLQ